MKYVEIAHHGGPEVLQLADAPAPIPGAGDVLIAVQAAGVSRADIMQRQGRYPPPAGAPEI
ncbi:MAG: NAD(P)H-quinone oxidoreductase, partial [Candidatus Eremiobacteraeota bacterium]|nr:NAD(P)H-quinone oxidoreductase [Candidatus Eremiobacteraeota bacterium]